MLKGAKKYKGFFQFDDYIFFAGSNNKERIDAEQRRKLKLWNCCNFPEQTEWLNAIIKDKANEKQI